MKKSGNSKDEPKEVYLDRAWIKKHNAIPHFCNVIKNVEDTEGVEITMNCNHAAFNWLVEMVHLKTDEIETISNERPGKAALTQIKKDTDSKMKLKLAEVNNENCLNIIVTSYFLQLGWVYTKVWEGYFKNNFSDVINHCKISLSSINPIIVNEIGTKMAEI